MKRIMIAGFLLCMVFLLGSCGKKSYTDTASRAARHIEYDGVVYSVDMILRGEASGSRRLHSWVLPKNKEEALAEPVIYPECVCGDPLCSHTTEDCPAFVSGAAYGLVLADPEASERRGSHVLFLCYNNYIARYCIGENRREEVVQFGDDIISPQIMWLYRGYLYVVGYSYNRQIKILRVDKETGKNLVQYQPENADDKTFTIIGFYDNYMYYRNSATEIWRVDLDMTEEKLLVTTMVDYNGIIQDGYLFYCRDIRERYDLCQLSPFFTVDLYCRKLGTGEEVFEGEEIFVDGDVIEFLNPNVFPAEGKILYNKCNPRLIGTKERKSDTGEVTTYGFYHDGSEKMWYYDPIKGKKGVLYEDFGANLFQYLSGNDRYLVISEDRNVQKEDGEWESDGYLYCYFYKDNVRTRLVQVIDEDYYNSQNSFQ